ncbi:GSCFA domain-containing protein [Niabella yanshanensis]|uniref:GSCFA domain-containing protein n=1 Tax=Niabella yanshanensis TaxID=577386 RepID=A0ABZ0WCH3_9BACT|nr:GSCFA domain-containing protein [Niabella yanshanensis]WQD40001.1 GSCFA domain-containing protein [Niabella yanshanensis]
MDFMSPIHIPKLPEPVAYGNKLLLIGSCFTEHIGNALADYKFNVLQNPHGILFEPASVRHSLISYIENKRYTEADLFYLNEIWSSWHHHSRFSHINKERALDAMNQSVEQAHHFLKDCDWVVITLGSAFSYILSSDNPEKERYDLHVANCHRAPGQWFYKKLLGIEEIIAAMDNTYHRLRTFNPKIKILFTVSPVRHLRDGVTENNRSKARLIEVVHHMVDKFPGVYYFPAYELVIDVLRDYRFYDIDLAHPNYQATEFVLEKFTEACIDDASKPIMKEVRQVSIARRHKAFQPDTHAHQQFLKAHYEKAKGLMEKYPFLNLKEEMDYFSGMN